MTGAGAATYHDRLLRTLAGGEWVDAHELTHPIFPRRGLEATVRLLQAVGYVIERDGTGGAARFRLIRTPPPPRGRTVRLRSDSDGRRAGEEGVILLHDGEAETELVMFLDGTAGTFPAAELDYADEPFAASETT